MRYKHLHISHLMVGIILNASFFKEDPCRVGDTVNILLLSYLYITAGYNVVLAERQWDIALYIIMITTYADTNSLLQIQRIAPTAG